MDTTALFDQITSKLRLKSEMTAVLICLDEFSNNFFAPKGSTELQRIFDNLPHDLGQVLKDNLLKQEVTHESHGPISKSLEELKDKLRKLNVIQLTLAFQPDEDAITTFSEWVKKNVGPTAIIDLQFDKTIVGGALIISGGQYKDFSVRKKLAGRFQIQRDEIMGLLT